MQGAGTEKSSVAAKTTAKSMLRSCLQAMHSTSERQQPEMLGCRRLSLTGGTTKLLVPGQSGESVDQDHQQHVE